VPPLLSLLRRPRPVQEAPAAPRPPKVSRSGTYAAQRPREPAEELDVEDFVRACRADEEHHFAFDVAVDEPAMMLDERGDRLTIPDV
jgi:hypothetical protein